MMTYIFSKKFKSYRKNILFSCNQENTRNTSNYIEDALKRSRDWVKLSQNNNIAIFSGSSNFDLSEEIAKRLGLILGKSDIKKFSDGELNIQLYDSLRGRSGYLIQSTSPPVNDNLIELLLLISTMKRTNAKYITAVIPYFGYGRTEMRMGLRAPNSAADIAKMLESMGVDRIIAIDLHSSQIDGFFGPKVPVENLEVQNLMADYLLNSNLINNYSNLVIVSPDARGVHRAKDFAQILMNRTGADINIKIIIKQRIKANEISKMELVGSVSGYDCVIIDDMIDTAGTLCLAADILKQNGAKNIFAFATHGVLSGKAIENINKSVIEKVIITNTIPLDKDKKTSKIIQLSVGTLIAETIRRIENKESLSQIFKQ